SAADPRRPLPSRRALRVRPESGHGVVARARRASSRPGVRHTAAPSPQQSLRHSTCSFDGTLPAESLYQSGGPGSCTPGPDRGRPAPQGAGVVVGRLVLSTSLPAVCPAPRAARRCLPSSGAFGPPFPTFPGTLLRSDCHTAHRRSLASRYLARFGSFVL